MSIRKVFFILIVFKFLSITSCCNDEHQIIGAGELTLTSWPTAYWVELESLSGQAATDFTLNNDYELSTDTIVGPFEMVNSLELELVNVEGINDIFINDILATSCEYNISNDIDASSLKLAIDDSFTYKNETVSAGDNLLLLDNLIIDSTMGLISINFTFEFMKEAIFENKDFTFELSYSLKDGEEFMITETRTIAL